MPRIVTRRKTTTTANGTRVVRTSTATAPDLEWRLQAEAVRRLRGMPLYCPAVPADGDLHPRAFTIAGDFNAARRSRQEATKAKATGLTPGEPDLRIFAAGGRLLMIELKAQKGAVSDEQIARHALLIGLGYMVVTIHASTEDECADLVEGAVEEWLAAGGVAGGWVANDNRKPVKSVRKIAAKSGTST